MDGLGVALCYPFVMSLDVSLHDGQLEIFEDPRRVRVAVMGRRYGKSRLMIWELLLAALGFPGVTDPVSPQMVLGAMPTLQMAKGILWEPLLSICTETEVAKTVKGINRTDHIISFHGGKPSIQILGANDRNGDGLRGKRIWFVGLDEYQDYKPGIFDLVIKPAMADTEGSRALITGTPKGKLNVLYEVFCRSQLFPQEYASFNHPTSKNNVTPGLLEEIEQARLIMPPRIFTQEFEASFVDFPGKIYSELSEDNLTDRCPESFDLTIMGIDWGDVHPAFVVLGLSQGVWHYLEGWQGYDGQPVPQPLQDAQIVRLAAKWGVQAVFCDPSRPSSILAVRSLGTQYRLPGLTKAVAGYNRIEEGLIQVHSLIYTKRLMFPRSHPQVDPRTPGTIGGKTAWELAMSYHRETNKAGQVTDKVAEGQSDHILDGLRYALANSKGVLAA